MARGKSFYSKKHRSWGYYIYKRNVKQGFIKQKGNPFKKRGRRSYKRR